MFQTRYVALFLALLVNPTQGLDSGIILRLDSCALLNVITDTLMGLDLIHLAEKDASVQKAISKKGGGSALKGISKMKVDSFKITDSTLVLDPAHGIKMSVTTKIAVSGKSIIGGKTEMKMVVKILTLTSLTQEPQACPKFGVEDCQTNLLDVKTNLPKGMLPGVMNNFVDKTLHKILPTLLCPPVEKVLQTLNGLLCKADATFPLGIAGSVQYVIPHLPTVTKQFFEIDFNTMIKPGLFEDVSDSPTNSSVYRDLPPNLHTTSLALTADFLSEAFTALQQEGTFNVNVSMEVDLFKSSFSDMIPRLPLMTQSVEVKIKAAKPIGVTMKPDKVLLHLLTTMEVLASTSDEDSKTLFVINCHINLKALLSVDTEKIHASLLLDKFVLLLASSSIGYFEVPVAEGFVQSVMSTYTSSINAHLEAGIPLPSILSMNFADAEPEIHQDLLLFSINACKDKRVL